MAHALLTPPLIAEIKRLYELRDPRGRRVWSQMRLAIHFGVSETTIYRVVNGARGASVPPSPSPEAAAESLRRLQSLDSSLLARLEAEVKREVELRPTNLLDEMKGTDELP